MRLFAILPALLLSAAFDQFAAAQGPVDYFPLKEGAKWVYALGKKDVTVTVDKKEAAKIVRLDDNQQKKKPEDVFAWRLTKQSDDKKQTELVAVLEDGIYRLESADKEISPPLCFLKFGAGAKRWKAESASAGVKLEGTFTGGADVITVPYFQKPVQAWKTECADFLVGKQKMALAFWFVPNVGLVKHRNKLGDHPELVLELKEYHPGK